jgi:hypothetical protein
MTKHEVILGSNNENGSEMAKEQLKIVQGKDIKVREEFEL